MTSVLFRGLPWRDDREGANLLQDERSLFIGDWGNRVQSDIARESMLFRSSEAQSEDEQPNTESEISSNTADTEDSLHWEDVEVSLVALSKSGDARRLAKTGTRHVRISEISMREFGDYTARAVRRAKRPCRVTSLFCRSIPQSYTRLLNYSRI